MDNTKRRIAVMGGTFDPIHYGHLAAAEAVRDRLKLNEIIFMPTGNPPHKKRLATTPADLRYELTALAIKDNPYFTISRIETDREGMSYTLDTCRELKSIYGKDCEISFIIGADSVEDLKIWHKPEKLLPMCRFIGITRPGYKTDKLKATISELEKDFGASIDLMETPDFDLSSTDLRNRVFAGKSLNYLTPPDVIKYIEDKELYPRCKYSLTDKAARLHDFLSPKRFLHSTGVAAEAESLAKTHGIDSERAYTAGLLHDCAKDLGKDKSFELCRKYGVPLDNVLTAQPDLIHSFLGAAVAKEEYGITDCDILNAIRHHTTGRADMTELEKIIYLADFFEPSRKPFDGMDEMRTLAYKSLDAAMKFSLNHTIEYNNKKNRLIHPLSIQAAEYYNK
jgi:nicotinate-nucleotide adenylyltransferase